MEAWSQCAGNVDPGRNSLPEGHESFPVELRSQLASLLAGMILSLQQEATA